ncbi:MULTISPECIES: Bpu10I family restriction endonuclease [unclassified Okeania]|uniref:Bpu10I family restriction endonuclease n=1 Tax=unclassified Okeania TaxID=2634635 RepID=UPI0013B5E833|nr:MULTISPECIES: Bpu10I family restriction endonuclease [unclassified Okeania]NES77855.1 Bpu10I family restriction endonuclease [Okeania sp. SIO1H4]NET20071.1 Bpu10I family restriction endonuclease [Okeania sp. SIO1H5]NET92080.1 Bpu10I family restriction endonuclease [Okeania sp. SIO1H2]
MYVHGQNLEQKENHKTKYRDEDSRRYLREIREKYNEWKLANEGLIGPLIEKTDQDSELLIKRVEFLNQYKDFLEQQHYAEKFDSRSNLHSSVLEEFMYYLFKDLVREFSSQALIGKSRTFKDIFFRSENYQDMLSDPHALIELKDNDFAIGVRIHAQMNCQGSQELESHIWDVPAVVIECKTYLDKTMLQDAATAVEQLKYRNPNAIYILVAEWLKLTDAVNLRKFKIDQIYVLRKQKNTDREFRYQKGYIKNPIYVDVVEHLFVNIRDYLTSDWEGGINFGLKRGYLI